MEQNKSKKSRKSTPSIACAVLIILFGAFVLISRNTGLTEMRPVIISWAMLAIITGILFFFHRHIFSGLAFLGAGGFFILPKLAKVYPQITLPDNFINNYWGALVIYIGILMLFAMLTKHKRGFTHTQYRKFKGKSSIFREKNEEFKSRIAESRKESSHWFKHSVVFSDNEYIFLEPMFEGGEIEVAFGDSKLDLRKTDIPEGITDLYISVGFGNCSLFLPQNWIINTRDGKIFAGKVSDRRIFLEKPAEDSPRKTLNLISSIICGNIDLRN